MEAKTKTELTLKLDYLGQLWQEFCEKHTELYEVTCDEYMHLISSEIDELESAVERKQSIIKYINHLDLQRNELTSEIETLFETEKNNKLTKLLPIIKANGFEAVADRIEKLNLILLDVIEKIQDQNKKNQFFLNKAIHSLNELRESFSGGKNYKTYSPNGMAKNSNTY